MGKRVLPIDTSALEAARAVAHAQRMKSNPARPDSEVYDEVDGLIQDENPESMNVAQDMLIENGCNLVDLGERNEDRAAIPGVVSIGRFALLPMLIAGRKTAGKTSPYAWTDVQWLVHDTWFRATIAGGGQEQQTPQTAMLNPTRRYAVTIDYTFRGRVTQRLIDPVAMIEDARRMAARICWEGAKALRYFLFRDDLEGGRAYSSGSADALWPEYVRTPPEVIDKQRPCDDFFAMVSDPDPLAMPRQSLPRTTID